MYTNLHILHSFIWVPIKSSLKLVHFICWLGITLFVFCLPPISYSIWQLKIFAVNTSDVEKVINFQPASNTIILDKHGQPISEQFSKYHIYKPFEEIPKHLIDSIVAIEDRKFFKHPGIDAYAIARAALAYFKNPNAGVNQGASTLTQQVVKNLLLTKEKTFSRKLREIILSLYLEKHISKQKILEIYCNHIFLGNGSYGVAAASKRYFNKDLKDINLAEAALIAGLFQSPTKYNPLENPDLAKSRQQEVLGALVASKKITSEEYAQLVAQELKYERYESLHGKIAPYYVDYVAKSAAEILKETKYNLKDSGLKIYTTLNQQLQQKLEESFIESTDIFNKLDKYVINTKELAEDLTKSEAAMLVMDRRTGEILAMKGGRDYQASQFNRTTDALRAPGSVFKPITYALALKNGHNWNDVHYVSPITIGNYRPRSSNSRLFSETTLLEAFYESINSPAVDIGNQLGVKNVIRFGKRLGIKTPIKEEAATLLGSSEVTMLDMARVYSTFANSGQQVEPIAITKIEDAEGNLIYQADEKHNSKIVMDNITNELIVEGLKQVVTRGTAYHANYLSQYAAGKTGTSNRSRDNWFCGFTDDLVIITWMGNDEQLPYRGYISASNTATVLWARFTNKTIKMLKTAKIESPNKVQVATIHPKYGHLDDQGIPMYFPKDFIPQKKTTDLLFLEKGQSTRLDFDEF